MGLLSQVLINGLIGMWELDPMRPQKPHSDKRTYQDLASVVPEYSLVFGFANPMRSPVKTPYCLRALT